MLVTRAAAALRFGLFIALLTVTACSLDSGVSTQTRFTAADAQTTGEGLVVVGMRLTRQPTESSLIFGRHLAPAWFLMSFRGLDANNRLTPIRRELQLCDVSRQSLLTPCEPLQMHYRVLRLPAGRYVLSNFAIFENHLTLNTNFVGAPEVFPLAGWHHAASHQPLKLDAFDVAAGEITYIGDFNWDAGVMPARFAMSRDDPAAQAALAQYPFITAPVVFRPMMSLPVAIAP